MRYVLPEYTASTFWRFKMVERVQGFAVVFNDVIDVRTVSETRRAAIVNWLVVASGCMIYNRTTDQQIEWLWEKNKGHAFVKGVTIE